MFCWAASFVGTMRNLADRVSSIRRVQDNALALQSRTSYVRYRLQFKRFCEDVLKKKPRYKPSRLLFFLEDLYSAGKAPATLRSVTSAIAYFARLKGVTNLSTDPGILAFLAGVERERSQVDCRRPLTPETLQRLAAYWRTNDPSNASLWISITSLALFGLFRIGELVPRTLTNQAHAVLRRHIEVDDDSVTVTLSTYKHNRAGKPSTICIPSQRGKFADICPVAHVRNLLRCGQEDCSNLALFSTTQSEVRLALAGALNSVLGSSARYYSFHSLRIGGASYFALLGWDEGRIRRFGRWSSNAFMRYIRQV